MNKIKRILFTWMEDYLCKHDEGRITKANINLPTTTINLAKYVPNDGKWHSFSITVSAHVKRNDEDKTSYQEVEKSVDGELKAKWYFGEAS